MKNLLRLLFAFSFLTSCCAGKLPLKPLKERTLDQVVQAVQDQYAKATIILGGKNIKIDISKADLTLKISSVSTENADVTVWIIKPSTKFIQTKTTSVTYELSADKSTLGSGPDKMAADDKLCNLIVDAATKFNQLHTTIGTLTKDNFTLDIVFSIENDNSIGLTFNILGIGSDAGYEHDSSVEHELVLTFIPKTKP